MLELIQKAFGLEDIRTEQSSGGFIFGSKIVKFFIPEDNFQRTLENFPFLKNALNAGLISVDKKTKSYCITSEIISCRSNHKKKVGKKQFFSFEGTDQRERTTIHDALVTISNVRQIAEKFRIDPKALKFSIRHKDGNPDEVVNFVRMDASIFGSSPEEIKKNIGKINNVVKFERKRVYE